MNYELIKEIALTKGLSIPKLADKISFSKAGLYFAISKKRMAINTLEDIAKALDVSITVSFEKENIANIYQDESFEHRISTLERQVRDIQLNS